MDVSDQNNRAKNNVDLYTISFFLFKKYNNI